MSQQVNQMELVMGITKCLEQQGIKEMNSRQINAVVKAADSIVAALKQPTAMAFPTMGLLAWLTSDDTGLSSKCMARVLCGANVDHAYSWNGHEIYPHPVDPDDFGRCYRFLKAVPIGPERAQGYVGMEKCSPQWKALVNHWDELTQLWEEESPTGKCPALYLRMQEILDSTKIITITEGKRCHKQKQTRSRSPRPKA